jgi:murein DD-endopeptidase MepM/ murein hydrolase activator NlpD
MLKILALFLLLQGEVNKDVSTDFSSCSYSCGTVGLERDLEAIEKDIQACSYDCVKVFSRFEKFVRNNVDEKYDYGMHKSFLEKNKQRLKKDLTEIMAKIEQYATFDAFDSSLEFSLPLREMKRRDIGLGGFIANRYDWFEGNYYKGHPAYDVFVHDKNQDCLDDRTKKPIEVYAVADGIVISTYKEWKKGSKIRGGNYVYLYNPKARLLFYYAHLGKIFVEEGDVVEKEQLIAYLCRTGKNAAEKRSPTHLHFSVFKYQNENFLPVDWLKDNLFKIEK